MNKGIFWIVLMASLMTACGSSPKEGRTPKQRLHQCPDPRPEVCTMDYNPVCAPVGEELQTFSNGCGACSERKVKGFYLGACPEPTPVDDPDPDDAEPDDEEGDDEEDDAEE